MMEPKNDIAAKDRREARQQDRQPPAAEYPAGDEISLLDIWDLLWPRKLFIAMFCLVCILAAAGAALWLPNVYRAEVLVSPAGDDEDKGRISSALGNLGGLASLAGVSMSSDGNVHEHLAVLKSREFIGEFIKEKELMPVLFAERWNAAEKRWIKTDAEEQPSEWDAYRRFSREILRVSRNEESALVTVAVEWTDAEQAAVWANGLVERLNDYLRQRAIDRSRRNLDYLREALDQTRVEEMRKTLYALIGEEQKKAMLAETQEEYAFRLLDPAVTPEEKVKPKRTLIVILAALFSFFLACFLVLGRASLRRVRKSREQRGGDREQIQEEP